MTKLTLTDLTASKELDHAAMTSIAGGRVLEVIPRSSFINDSYKYQDIDNSVRILEQATAQGNQANGNGYSAVMQSNNAATAGQAGDNGSGFGFGWFN